MKLNETKESVEERTATVNHEGGEAYEPDSPELGLTKVVINNLLEDSFYESDTESLAKVEQRFEAVADSNPEFALKLAAYARQEENLRTIPQVLLVLAANDERTQKYVRDYASSVMSRADEPLDVLAFHVDHSGSTSIPEALRLGIEDAMHTWNEWQYAKWDRDSREWQYRDLLNLVHPKPRDEERETIFKKIAHGDLSDYPETEPLKQEDTWESSLSSTEDDRSKEEKYREQLEEGNMGLFPRVRQARDMLESGVSAEEIYGDVTDEWIQNSRMYPFRFYQAYKAINGQGVGTRRGLRSDKPDIPESERREASEFLEHAMKVSTSNLPSVLEDTFVAVDTSGSMNSSVSNDSDLECVEIASLFGSLVYERGADLAAFASDIQEFHEDRRNPITTNMKNIQSSSVGGGTNGYLVPKALREHDRDDYSQIIVFTDMQMWGGGLFNDGETFKDEWRAYKQANPDASLYLVDLQSYGSLVTPEGAQDVYNISGWTSNVIDFIDKMENVDAMVQAIESFEP